MWNDWEDLKQDFKKSHEEVKEAGRDLRDAAGLAAKQTKDFAKAAGKKINAFLKDDGLIKVALSGGLITSVAITSTGLMSDNALKTLLGAGIGVVSGVLSFKFIKRRSAKAGKQNHENNDYYTKHRPNHDYQNAREPYDITRYGYDKNRNCYTIHPDQIQDIDENEM